MLGISTSSFYGRLTTEEAIDAIAKMGVGCAEVFLNTFSEYTYEYIMMVSDRLKKNGLVFGTVHTLPTQFEPQLFALTNRQRDDAKRFFKEILKGAADGGCTTYVMHGKPFFKKNVNSFKVDIQNIADNMNKLCDIAGKYGVKIALENVHWAMCNNIDFINEINFKVPMLRYTLDIKQAHLSGIHWQEYISAFGSRLANVHICDYIGKNTCLPGRGEVDFTKLKASLDDIGYSGNEIVEVYERDYKDFEDLKKSVDFCKGFFRG